jgi:predicted transcriptional regulator of viral defense system
LTISKFDKNLHKIVAFFDRSEQRVFTESDLAQLLAEQQNPDSELKLGKSLTASQFIEKLLEKTKLRQIEIRSMMEASKTRYIWEEVTPYEVALSLKANSYLSHGSAVFLHGLTEQLPRVIYLNKEQSVKAQSRPVSLTQEGIDKAFSKPQRISESEFVYGENRILLLNGKNTGRLEVIKLGGEQNAILELTSLERTLIDITVRPAYAGGVFQVLEAFKGARERISINTLVATLRKLNYAYPYHQAIGFYMQRAGFTEKQFNKLKEFGLQYDFYLGHGIATKEPQYDKQWKLYFPQGF